MCLHLNCTDVGFFYVLEVVARNYVFSSVQKHNSITSRFNPLTAGAAYIWVLVFYLQITTF